ncbi:DUF4142 domain-containing protein [Pedobacter sp.]|uniref:DUF4142 domain-containing protein n=1 Tax=Pedobacter sp. TaxID=1411316 RepID=UPI003D7F6139
MKHKILFTALIAGACTFQACQNANKTSNDPDSLTTGLVDSANQAMEDTAGINNNDTANFITQAAIGGKMEVELGNLAQKQAASAAVKEFGALMVKDHSKANTELKMIAGTKKVDLPDGFPAAIQSHIDSMKNMKGADFDKHYMTMMVQDHVKDIALFKAATGNSDADISGFAKKTLPVLETHHQKATAIQKSLK